MLRPQSVDQPQDIVFEAEEDLFHNSPSRELLMLKGSIKVVPLTRNRMFQSYVNEFCGMVSSASGSSHIGISGGGGVLASNTLRFSLNAATTSSDRSGRENIHMINPCKIINAPCHVKVWHTHDFINASNSSLKPAMKAMFEQGFCSDLKLDFEGKKKFNVHKAILAVRSSKINKLI